LVPHVLPQFRTLVRPPTSPPLISYFSTASQPLPTHIPNPKRETGRAGSARSSATITSHPRRLRLSVARPSDGPTIKGDRLARRASHLRACAGARVEWVLDSEVGTSPSSGPLDRGMLARRRSSAGSIPKATDEHVTLDQAPAAPFRRTGRRASLNDASRSVTPPHA